MTIKNAQQSELNDQAGANQPSSDTFILTSVLKRDVFSETRTGYFKGDEKTRIVYRIVSASPIWSRPLAWFLANREIRALKAVRGIELVPQLIKTDKDGLFRSWTEGTPLHLARPNSKEFYQSGYKILRALRRAHITHNDLAKPQNWLMTPDGKAALIDFQLASYHKKKGALYRYFAYEDMRHLIKQKNSFAPELMTHTEKRILRARSWPSTFWLASGKKLYNFITKGIFQWSDGEGTADRIQQQAPLIKTLLAPFDCVQDIAYTTYPLAAKGVGLYVFIEGKNCDKAQIKQTLKGQKIECLQFVDKLPRRQDGEVRDDILKLVAMNEMNDLDILLASEPDMEAIVKPIIANRLNFTDRRLRDYEAARHT